MHKFRLTSFFLFLFHAQIFCLSFQDDTNDLFGLLQPDYDSNKITVLKFELTRNRNYIAYIMDKAQNMFIVKQTKDCDPASKVGQRRSICEVLTAYVAESNGIPANRIRIIPAGYALPGKLFVHRPATLHTLVPGEPYTSKDYPSIIRQINKKILPEHKRGLTYRVVHGMSLHPDLPLIAALDTFVGNSDRGNYNLFYDQEADRFWAIDLEISFKKNLVQLACKFIASLLNDKRFELTRQELHGLISYRDTLKKLIKRHPPHQLHLKLDELVAQAGIIPGSSLYNKKVGKIIESNKQIISENYQSSQELVALLDKLIAYQKKNKNVDLDLT